MVWIFGFLGQTSWVFHKKEKTQKYRKYFQCSPSIPFLKKIADFFKAYFFFLSGGPFLCLACQVSKSCPRGQPRGSPVGTRLYIRLLCSVRPLVLGAVSRFVFISENKRVMYRRAVLHLGAGGLTDGEPRVSGAQVLWLGLGRGRDGSRAGLSRDSCEGAAVWPEGGPAETQPRPSCPPTPAAEGRIRSRPVFSSQGQRTESQPRTLEGHTVGRGREEPRG